MLSPSEKTNLLDSARFNYVPPIRSKYSWLTIGILTAWVVLTSTIQGVALPLWLASFGSQLGGPYTTLLLSSMFSLAYFTILYIVISQTYSDCTVANFRKYLTRYVAMGISDALNGLMTVYCSSPNRVPPVVLAILPNTVILYSMVCTKLLIPSKRNLSYFHPLPILSVFLVFVGVAISLIPTFEDLADGKQKFWSGRDAVAYVPLYIISLAPAVVFNVLQERTMAERELDDMVESCMFNLMTVMLCFWIDLIPKWGHSKSLSMLISSTARALRCAVWGKPACSHKVLFLGILFNLGWSMNLSATMAINSESANYAAIGSAISSPLAAIFFLVFPKVLPPGSPSNPPLWSVVPALFLSLLGTVCWKYWEKGAGAPKKNHQLESVSS